MKFLKALEKLGIEFLTQHSKECFYIRRYKEFGFNFLNFLRDSINLNLNEIVNMKELREPINSCILYWALKESDETRRDENN